jgi:hypothetical protein
MKLLGIEITEEHFDYLMCEQAKGKELKVLNGKVVAVEYEITEEEMKNKRITEIKPRLEQLSQDIIQSLAGAEFEDLAERKKEFQTLHNELRILLGKEPRKYLEVDNETNN